MPVTRTGKAMIVTCPACSARYKIDESKIQGRGAKITCPKCAHRFVVAADGSIRPEDGDEGGIPGDLSKRDFRSVGVSWTVRKANGQTLSFHDLDSLQDWLDDGVVGKRDAISSDGKAFTAIEAISDLEEHFWEVWQAAVAGGGEAKAPAEASPFGDGFGSSFGEKKKGGADDEDADDAPTQLVGSGSGLADEIRKALDDTPAPAASRQNKPRLSEATAPPGARALAASEDDDEREPLTSPPPKAPAAAKSKEKPPPALETLVPEGTLHPLAAAEPVKAPVPSIPPPAPAPAKPASPPAKGGLPIGLLVAGVLVVVVILGVIAVVGLGLGAAT